MKQKHFILALVAMLWSFSVSAQTTVTTEDGTLEEATSVAKIGSSAYVTFAEALTAASAMSGDITVELYDKVTLNSSLSGSYSSIKFVGKDTDAEIYLDVQGYITATGKKVAFENLTLSKSAGDYITNAGFMNVAFGIYDVTEVTYTNCTFANGAYASSGTVTFNGCTFYRSHDKYSLWAYGNVETTVENCTFADYRGIKMYAEGAAKTVDLTVKNTDFSAVTDKPAIVLTYGESVTLEGNTYSSTGTFELDLDGAPNGTTVTSDVAPTCKNDNGACGVLVDGNIYTTVAQAADVATEGSNVTLLYSTTEEVKFAEGVTLTLANGVTAENVTVIQPVAQIGDVKYASLQEALDAAAAGTGNMTVTILENVDLNGVTWTPVTVSAPGYPVVTVEGNNMTITGLTDMLFAGTWAGGSGLIIKNLTIKNSAIVNDKDDAKGTVGVGAFIGYPQASATITLDNCHLTESSVEGGHWTGGLIGMAGGYNGTDGPVFMNLTIKDCSVTNSTITGKGSAGGVIGHGSCAAWTNVVIENTTVSDNTVTSTGSSTNKAGAVMGTIGAAGQETTVNGVTKTGGASVSATVSGNTVASGGTTITTIYGRQGSATGMLAVAGGSYDNYPIEQGVAYAAPAVGYKIEQNNDGTYGVVTDPAYGKVAKIGDTYYETLAEAVAAANSGETITLLNGEHELPLFSGKELTFKGESKDGVIVNDAPDARTQGWNGSTFHFENLTAKGATANYHGLANGVVEVTYTNCNVNGLRFLYAPTVSFEGCAFNAEGVEHSFWTYGASEITVTNCTFTYTDRAVNCYSENGAEHETDIAFTGCSFTYAGTSDAPAGAVEINSGSVKSIELTMDNCTAPASGDMWFNSQWDSTGGVNTVVVVDGVTVWKAVAKVGDTYYTTIAEAIKAAQADEVVTIAAGDYTENLSVNKAITVEGQTDAEGNNLVNITGKLNITADGATVKNINVNNGSSNAGYINAKDVLVEGCTVVGGNGFRSCYTTGTVTFKNSVITGSTYGIHFDGSAGGNIVIDNCTITGWTSFASTITKVTMNATRFDKGNYNYVRFYQEEVELTGCSFNENMNVDFAVENVAATVNECTVDGGRTVESLFEDEDIANSSITVDNEALTRAAKIGDTYYKTLTGAFTAVQAGETLTLLQDVTMSEILVLDKAITLDGNGKTLTYTGSGASARAIDVPSIDDVQLEVTIKNLTVDCTASYCQRGINYNEDGKFTLEGVTVKGTNVTYAVNLPGMSDNAVVTIKDSDISGNIALNVWGENSTVNVENTNLTAVDNNTAEGYATVKLNNDGTTAAEGTVINITGGKIDVTGSACTDTEAVSNATSTGEINISDSTTVNGEVATLVAVIKYADGSYYSFKTLADAIAKVKDGETIVLIRDVTHDYNARDAYETQANTVTIDGNGHTLTLNQTNSDWASFGLANDAKLVLNNMTIEKTGYGDTSGAWNTHAIIFSCPVEMTDVTVNNGIAVQAGATLNNVTINEANGYYGLWVNGNGQTVTVNGGEINATNGGRGIKVADQYIDAPAQVTLNVTGTAFNTAKKAAVLVTSTAGAKIAASNVNIDNVAEDNVNFVWVDEDRAANYSAVEVTGAAVAQEAVESFPIIVKDGDKVVSYFKTLDDLFDNVSAYAKVSNVTVELTGDVVATKVVKTNSLKTYNFVTNVAEGVTMDLQYADSWNYFRKVNIGENVTVKCKYLVFSTETTIAGTVDAYYPYINGGKVTVAETGTLKYEGGDGLQVKGDGAVLTVNGTVIAPTINVWAGNAQLVVSGANAKVESNWIDIWDGTPSVAINNGATIETNKIKVSRGGEITVTDANLIAAESIEVGHNGDSAGKLTESGNSTITGEIKMTATGSTVASDGGLNVTTDLEGYKVVYAEGQYKVVAIENLVAQIGESYYETLAAAAAAAKAGETITLLADITEDVTIGKSVTIDGADKNYTGNIEVVGSSVNATIKNVNFVNGTGYAVKTNTIKSVTIESCTATGYTYGFLYANKSTPTITIKNVTIDGGDSGLNWNYGTTATLENVVMTNVEYGIRTRNYGAKTFTINNCNIAATYPIYVDEQGTSQQTFAFEGENNLSKTIDELSLSEYAVIKGANVGTYYGSLQSMVEKAESGQTVKLLSDIAMTEADCVVGADRKVLVDVAGKDITLDMNGKMISVTHEDEFTNDYIVAVIRVADGAGLTVTGNGTIDVTALNGNPDIAYMFWKRGTTGHLTILNGTFNMNDAADSMVYTNGNEIVFVKGGTWTLDVYGTRGNREPWIFNVQGAGDNHVVVTGGTYNADINRQYWSNEVVVPETYYTVSNDDNTYTVMEGAVAYVNEGMLTGPYFISKNIGYATLSEAVAAVDENETVTMLQDVTLEETLVVTADKKNITLDLAGKTVSMADASGKGAYAIKNQGNLTIADNSEAKTGKITFNSTTPDNSFGYATSTIGNAGNLTVESGTIENTTVGGASYAIDGIWHTGDVSLTINGGTMVANKIAVRQVPFSATAKNVVTVNGGTLNGATAGMQLFNTSNEAMLAEVNINGGEFFGTYGFYTSFASAAASKNAVIKITAGTFHGYPYIYNGNSGSDATPMTVSVSGGYFDNMPYIYTKDASGNQVAIAAITGGTYGFDVTDYCAEDFRCVLGSDDRYIIERSGFHFVDGEFTEYVNDKDVENATITYERASIPTTWTPFYVPFEVPVSQLADQGFEVAYINGVRRTDDDNDGELDKFVMEVIYIHGGNADGSAKTLKANYPYFIRTKGSERKDLSIVLEATLYAAKENTYDCTTMTEEFEIIGNNRTMPSDEFAINKFIVSSGKWLNINEGASLKPFRFYMTETVREGSETVVPMTTMSIAVRGEEREDGTTLIYDVEMNDEPNTDYIYDLQGRRVLEPQKGGLYIVNGKKVIF